VSRPPGEPSAAARPSEAPELLRAGALAPPSLPVLASAPSVAARRRRGRERSRRPAPFCSSAPYPAGPSRTHPAADRARARRTLGRVILDAARMASSGTSRGERQSAPQRTRSGARDAAVG